MKILLSNDENSWPLVLPTGEQIIADANPDVVTLHSITDDIFRTLSNFKTRSWTRAVLQEKRLHTYLRR